MSEYIARNELKDIIVLMKGSYTTEAIIGFIDSWVWAREFPYAHKVKEAIKSKARHSFVLQHDMDEKWSLFFVELFRFAFEQAGTKIHFEHPTNTITF